MPIPKIVHFTWKSKTLPRDSARIFEKWRKAYPDWDLRLYDDADIRSLVAERYPEHLSTFDAYPSGIYRADAFRFFALHAFGGLYADLDVVPLADLAPLLEATDCFVGAEPESHVRANDALIRGMPFVLCNAFMGSVPGHPFWERCMQRMADCACDDVVDATGPRFINGVALTIARSERPDVLLPQVWSPEDGFRRKAPVTRGYAQRLAQHFEVLDLGTEALVSHLWRHSWFLPVAYRGPEFWRWPSQLAWRLRRLRHREVARTKIGRPSIDYDWQMPDAAPEPRPLILALDLTDGEAFPGWADQLAGDKAKTRVVAFVPDHTDAAASDAVERISTGQRGAALRNAMLDLARERNADCLIASGRLREVPSDAIDRMRGAGRPVVTAFVRGVDGRERNSDSVLYGEDIFALLLRDGALEGQVTGRGSRQRLPFRHHRYLRVAPLSVVGHAFLFVSREAIGAGVRFAEQPYKYHVDSQGLAIMARDKGFEVCGLPHLEVVLD